MIDTHTSEQVPYLINDVFRLPLVEPLPHPVAERTLPLAPPTAQDRETEIRVRARRPPDEPVDVRPEVRIQVYG